eukprot:286296_1
MNDITNYFSMSNGTMTNSKNAFDVLGKKKTKKKKKSKYTKTKLTISFENENKVKVPIKISKTKMITSLGEICIEKGYHATSYIYPIGYKCVIAQLPSLKRPGSTTTFTTIIKRSESGPIFELTCSDDKNFNLSAKNPSKIWGQLKQSWNELEEQQKTNTTTATATATTTATATSKTTSPNT